VNWGTSKKSVAGEGGSGHSKARSDAKVSRCPPSWDREVRRGVREDLYKGWGIEAIETKPLLSHLKAERGGRKVGPLWIELLREENNILGISMEKWSGVWAGKTCCQKKLGGERIETRRNRKRS